jgi:hypothetical protein
MQPLEQIQAINEQANGPGVWETPRPKPASSHVALQDANERASDAIAEYAEYARTELGKRCWL